MGKEKRERIISPQTIYLRVSVKETFTLQSISFSLTFYDRSKIFKQVQWAKSGGGGVVTIVAVKVVHCGSGGRGGGGSVWLW